MVNLICPDCEDFMLSLFEEHTRDQSVENWRCEQCKKSYKRHTIRNKIGLVKSDNLYALNEKGEYTIKVD